MSTQLFAVAMMRAARSLRFRFTVLLLMLLVIDGGTYAKPSAQVVDTLPPHVPASCPKTEHTVTTATQLISELSSGFSGTIDNNIFEFWSVGVDVSRGWPGAWDPETGCREKASLISITRTTSIAMRLRNSDTAWA